jgi:hypothetical protein
MKAEILADDSYHVELDQPLVSIDFHTKGCTDTECPCQDVFLVCDCEGLQFQVNTDVDHWRLKGVTPDTPQTRELADALLEAVAKTVGRKIHWNFEQKYIDQRLEAYRVPAEAVRNGEMISHLQVITDSSRPSEKFGLGYGVFEVDGRAFLTDVYYCSNPKCDCRQSEVVFMEAWLGEAPKEKKINGLLHLGWGFDGDTEIREQQHLSQAQAQQLIRAWTAKHGEKMEVFKAEYQETKQIGRRSLRDGTPAPSASPKVGRNAPCPCGSGKKYKRCCGA